MSEWQSIDSAPKDGTEILAFEPLDKERFEHGGRIFVTWWSPRPIKERFQRHWTMTIDRGPTHWQPLPASPESKLMQEND